MPSLYTPFLAQAGANFGNAMESRGQRERLEAQNKLAGDAYLGNPQALQELMSLNPALGAKIMEESRKRKESQQQQSLNKRTQFKKELDDYRGKLSNFDTFEESEPYGQRMTAYFQKTYPDQLSERGLDAKYDIDDYEEGQRFGSGETTTAAPKPYPPVTMVNPDTQKKILVQPVVDPNTGKLTLGEYDLSEYTDAGYEIMAETPEQKSGRDIYTSLKKVTDKLTAQLESKEGEYKQQAKWKPKIEALVTEAKAKAKERGEALTDYNIAKAAMPGLLESVAELRELGMMATYTIAGRSWDAIVRESGFGATEGATARAKFIAIINNQVLPLLKATFGAAFTEREGETLKATMGDPNATPEEKMAQLDAFIELKYRTMEAKHRQFLDSQDESKEKPEILKFDAQGNQL